VPEVELTAAMLADLPEELLQRLRETTLELNMEVILEVIDRIEAHAPETAEHLRALVQTFQIQRIREVLKKVEDK
jgi:indole-3-glycerol phosphate synthase